MEMNKLPPDVLNNFKDGGFGFQRKSNLSSVDVDHATDWMNGICKGVA